MSAVAGLPETLQHVSHALISPIPVLFIIFVAACFRSAVNVLWAIMSHFRPKIGKTATFNDFFVTPKQDDI